MPSALAELILWMLKKNPDDRIGSAHELISELKRVLRESQD